MEAKKRLHLHSSNKKIGRFLLENAHCEEPFLFGSQQHGTQIRLIQLSSVPTKRRKPFVLIN
jgi:hypothetical protein